MKGSVTIENVLERLKNFPFVSNGFIPIYSNLRTIKGYNLNKQPMVQSQLHVYITPNLEQKHFSVDLNELLSKEYGACILEFVDVIMAKFNQKVLINFYNNINNLNVIKISDDNQGTLGSGVEGIYSPRKNTIKICEGSTETIYHELFHMASAYLDGDICYAGFKQSKLGFKANGVGINEGYTQLLTERYFGDKIEIFGAYEYEVSIVSQLEKIVGREKMEQLYLSSDLKGLILELKKYTSEEEIITFISNMDFLLRRRREEIRGKRKVALQIMKDINEFLYKTYFTKLNQMFNHQEIDVCVLNEEIALFVSTLKPQADLDNQSYKCLSYDDMTKYILDLFGASNITMFSNEGRIK